MTALRDSVAPHRSDQMAMIDLASSCGIGSTRIVGHAYDVALPVVLAGFSKAVATDMGAEELHKLSLQLNRTERSRPDSLFGAPGHPLIRAVAAQVFGAEVGLVQAEVARSSGLGSADRLIEIISLVCLASAAGSADAPASLSAFVVTVGAADADAEAVPPPPPLGTQPPVTGPSAALPAETPTTRSTRLADATTASGTQLDAPSSELGPAAAIPPPVAVVGAGVLADPKIEDDRGSRTPWFLGAAAVLLLLVAGVAVLAGRDDTEDSGGALVSEESAESAEIPSDDATPADDDAAPAASEPITTEAPAGDEVAVETDTADTDDGEVADDDATVDAADGDAATADDATAVDFAGLADDPDVETMSIPLNDIEDPGRDASGVLQFGLNKVTGEVCYSVVSEGIAAPYSGHIHDGVLGEKGGIVVDLGPLESGDEGCIDNLPVDTNDILADPAGHYAEIHDAGGIWTLRGQLTEDTDANAGEDTGETPVAPQVDADGGGASIRLDQGIIYLEGAVADQETADSLAASLSNVDADTQIVNDLTVEDGAPLPSGRIVIADAIFFETDGVDLQLIDAPTLIAITALANSQPGSVLTVVGHTDDRGSEVLNLELSLRRAAAARDLLVELGFPAENLRIRGAGETAPLGDNATPEGRALNRRIEFELTPQA